MNFLELQGEIVRHIRGARSQRLINEKLGYRFNQIHRWETGRAVAPWPQFVAFAGEKLGLALKKAYSFSEDPSSTDKLVRHFVARRKQDEVAKQLNVSRSTMSRWMTGRTSPDLVQMLQLMQNGSIDFHRFLEQLVENKPLRSIREETQREVHLFELYAKYPWLSVLLSALDLAAYPQNPTTSFLAEKSRLPKDLVKEALEDLSRFDLIHWNGKCWVANFSRISWTIKNSHESRHRMAEFVFTKVRESLGSSAFGAPGNKHGWKLFSVNRRQVDIILQKYTEFFNELGTLVDQGQEGADAVYLFAASLVDFERPPPAEES